MKINLICEKSKILLQRQMIINTETMIVNEH